MTPVPTRSHLAALAALCEGGEGPDREIDALIFARVTHCQTMPLLLHRTGWVELGGQPVEAPSFTGSVDAALTLFTRRPVLVLADPRQACAVALRRLGHLTET